MFHLFPILMYFGYVYYYAYVVYYLLRYTQRKYQASSMLYNNAPLTVNTGISGNLCLRDGKIEISESVVTNSARYAVLNPRRSYESNRRNEKSDRLTRPPRVTDEE